jgi:hypothetical protein
MAEWKPTPKQLSFLQIPFSVKEGFYAGALGAGKTDVLLLYPILHRLHENPNFKGLFLRRTFPELSNEVIPRSRQFFRALGATFNKQGKTWEFPSGALFFFGHCENEDDVHNYDSMQPNYVAFDELTSFTEWQYIYITLERCRAKTGSGLPAIVRAASNPGNIGHNWVRKRFIDPIPTGLKLIQGKSGIKRIYIPATIDDNPHIDPEYRKSLEALPESEKQAKLYGRWDAFEGSVFDEYREKLFSDEPENALHIVEPFDIPSFWPKIVAMDWGYAPPAMTWVGYLAISPDGRVYVYREQSFQKTKIAEWTPYVKEFIDAEKPRVIKLCKSGGQDRGQEHTIQSEIEKGLGHPVELTNNAPGTRVAGKMLFHEYLRWKQRYVPMGKKEAYNQDVAESMLRNRGLKEYQSYLDSFKEPVLESNLPKLQIFKNCDLLRNAIKSCIYDKTHPQDVAEFPGDDPYDGIRYGIDEADKFFQSAARELREINQRKELEDRLTETGDMTAFYRNARRLENTSETYGVRRYHHA